MELESRVGELEQRVARLEAGSYRSALGESINQLVVGRGPIFLAAAIWIVLAIGIHRFAFNWPQADDFLLADWFRKLSMSGQMSLWDIISVRNGPHPVGLQALISVAVWAITGPDFSIFPLLNALTVGVAAAFLIAAVGPQKPGLLSWVFPVIVLLSFMHPIQANHLIWPFEFGWFLVTLWVAVNAWLVERYGSNAWPVLIVTCIAATLCSGQGAFAWLLVSFHLVLKGRDRKSLAVSAAGLLLFAAISLKLAQGGSGMAAIAAKGWAAFFLYYFQLFGCVFGSRDPAVCVRMGAVAVYLPIFAFVAACVVSRRLTPKLRLALVYFAAALAMTAGFAFARFEYGLQWALATFHAAPLLIQICLATVLTGWGLFEVSFDSKRVTAFAGVLVGLFPLVSFVSAIPYAKVRLDEQRTARAVSMVVACFETPDDQRLLATAGMGLEHVRLVRDNLGLLKPLCTRTLPDRAARLMSFPPELAKAAGNDPVKRAGLEAFWRIYQTHYDLQRAFNVYDPNLAHELVDFVKNNATTGSGYEPDVLKPYAEAFLAIGEF